MHSVCATSNGRSWRLVVDPKQLERWAVFAFGVVFVVVILVMAVAFPQPSTFQYTTFRVVLALAAAGVVAFVPGFLHVKLGSWLRAGGALAVFVVVYRFGPAPLVVEVPLDPEDVLLLENYEIQCDAGDSIACNSAGVMIGDGEGSSRNYELSATFSVI